MMNKVQKKVDSPDAVHFVVKFISSLGHVRIRLKDDPEPAALELRNAVISEVKKRHVDIKPDQNILERSGVGSKQSNGRFEQAI